MNYKLTETTFLSKDGKTQINAEIYSPRTKKPRGVIQLAHGMLDYVARYEGLADFLTGEGYVFAGHHHLGHGKSVENPDDFGFFDEEHGIEYLLADMHTMNKYLREKYQGIPLIVMGHSMGSFITRLYVTEHPHSMSGVIIHGTGGPNPLVGVGKLLAKMIKKTKGARHRSPLINSLAFGSYNSKFPKSEGDAAWLTRDVARVSGRAEDKYSNFLFTVSAFIDLFEMLDRCNKREWFAAYPKDIPTLVISGDMDPVGNYGKGPDYVYKQLLIAGCGKIAVKSYEGARHELFNETNREEVFSDMLEWIKSVQ